MRIRPKAAENEENIFWVTMTDLMTGLVLVFMVLFFWAYMQGHMDKIQEQVAQQSVSEEMKKSLNEQNIEAEVESSGVVKIQNLELFEVGSYELSDKGKEYLNKFAPIYLNSIFSNEFLSKNVDLLYIIMVYLRFFVYFGTVCCASGSVTFFRLPANIDLQWSC